MNKKTKYTCVISSSVAAKATFRIGQRLLRRLIVSHRRYARFRISKEAVGPARVNSSP